MPNTAQVTVEPAQAATNVVAVVFVFCGNGAGRTDLVQRCQDLPQRADAADLVMPSKPTGMLASVVQTCGLAVPPEDPAALAQAVLTVR